MSPTYKAARKRVTDKWGTDVRHNVGDAIYQALICEAVFFICCTQDATVSGDAIKRIINDAQTDLIQEMN